MIASTTGEWPPVSSADSGGVSNWTSDQLANGPYTVTPISSLVLGHTPRNVDTYQEHVRNLAEVESDLPPILVHKPSGRVIDGAHRVRAAALRGERSIRARMYSGSLDDAFVLAVSINSQHGLPLSRAERRSAAIKILQSHPQWSDRVIAKITGFASGTIGRLRQQSVDPDSLPLARIGKDGRVRPLDSAGGRQRVRELVIERPTASNRVIAKEAGVSASTVLNVRRRMVDNTEVKLPKSQHRHQENGDVADASPSRANESKVNDVGASSAETALGMLLQDPTIRFNVRGRFLLRWLSISREGTESARQIIDSIPDHCAATVAKLARSYALAWADIANQLEKRSLPDQHARH
jgi:ParB-like chromosome segregation protein Spo0J